MRPESNQSSKNRKINAGTSRRCSCLDMAQLGSIGHSYGHKLMFLMRFPLISEAVCKSSCFPWHVSHRQKKSLRQKTLDPETRTISKANRVVFYWDIWRGISRFLGGCVILCDFLCMIGYDYLMCFNYENWFVNFFFLGGGEVEQYSLYFH